MHIISPPQPLFLALIVSVIQPCVAQLPFEHEILPTEIREMLSQTTSYNKMYVHNKHTIKIVLFRRSHLKHMLQNF